MQKRPEKRRPRAPSSQAIALNQAAQSLTTPHQAQRRACIGAAAQNTPRRRLHPSEPSPPGPCAVLPVAKAASGSVQRNMRSIWPMYTAGLLGARAPPVPTASAAAPSPARATAATPQHQPGAGNAGYVRQPAKDTAQRAISGFALHGDQQQLAADCAANVLHVRRGGACA